MLAIRTYDTVRVRMLKSPAREFTGTSGVSREPRVGDVATVCHEYSPNDVNAPVAVELVNENGETVWLADFDRAELELLSSSEPDP
jgi:hypothetical protein